MLYGFRAKIPEKNGMEWSVPFRVLVTTRGRAFQIRTNLHKYDERDVELDLIVSLAVEAYDLVGALEKEI